MFAKRIVNFTGPDDVQWAEVDEPAADGGVLIDVAATAVSFADLLQTRGAYQMKVPLRYTPGMDAAGVVRSAPPGTGLAAGQRVAVLLDYGCWQEVVSVPPARVLPLPDGMSFEAGAAAPLNYLTALFALARRAHAQPGDTLLVHGAAGGVGTAAIQLGRALGLRTVAVVSEEAKEDFALRCGAHHAVLSGELPGPLADFSGVAADPIRSMLAVISLVEPENLRRCHGQSHIRCNRAAPAYCRAPCPRRLDTGASSGRAWLPLSSAPVRTARLQNARSASSTDTRGSHNASRRSAAICAPGSSPLTRWARP